LYSGVVVGRVDVGQQTGRIPEPVQIWRSEFGDVENTAEGRCPPAARLDVVRDAVEGGGLVTRDKWLDASGRSYPRAIVSGAELGEVGEQVAGEKGEVAGDHNHPLA
jgi:hypothetical protein